MFDRVEITFILVLFYCLKPLTNVHQHILVYGILWYVALSGAVMAGFLTALLFPPLPASGNGFSHVIVTASLAQWLRRPSRERKIPGSNPAGARIISGSSHTSDLKIGTPVATLPGAWCYRVSTWTGQPGVSIL